MLDLLSTVRRGAVPVSALVAAGRILDVEESAVRVALARLRADGRVESDERGLYRLRPGGVEAEVRSWRRIEERLRRWSGDWIGVVTAGLPRGRAAARHRGTALRFLGFRTLRPGLELRPDNLAGGVADTRERLLRLGLPPEAAALRLADLDPETERRARSLWDAPALVAGYRAMRRRLEESAARLPRLQAEAAMAESFLVGGEGIRLLVLDPLLPEPIVPAEERRALLATMKRYDRLGRRAWAGWLGGAKRLPDDLPAGIGAVPAHATSAPAAAEVS